MEQKQLSMTLLQEQLIRSCEIGIRKDGNRNIVAETEIRNREAGGAKKMLLNRNSEAGTVKMEH